MTPVVNVSFFQLTHPYPTDRQWDSADEHPLQGEVPQGHPGDGGEAHQVHKWPWEAGWPRNVTW